MVRNVTENVTIEAVKSHFQEAFGFAPNDVQITFDETELLEILAEIETLINSVNCLRAGHRAQPCHLMLC